MFTLAETETETDKKWLEKNCVEVFILQRDRDRRKFPLGTVHILSVSVLISVSESGRVKEPLHFKCGFTCGLQENVPQWAVTSNANTFRRNYQYTFSYQKTCLEAGDTHTLRTNVLLPIIYHVLGQFLCHVPQLFPESFIHRSQKFHFTFSFLCCIGCFWRLP